MAILSVAQQEELQIHLQNGTLMIHNDPPAMIVMATGFATSDGLFQGVELGTGNFSVGWEANQFTIFRGTITLEQ